MCTAIACFADGLYFGRTLDYHVSYGETVTLTPRRFPLNFKHERKITDHYAIIGIAHVEQEYPLYYDAMNEEGLCMAGLNFCGNAHFTPPTEGKINVAQFEFVPWVLSTCKTVEEVRALLKTICLTDTPFADGYPVASLHWLIADTKQCITVEAVEEGVCVYDNPVGVLTNNPPFEEQLKRWEKYRQLTATQPPYEGDPRAYSLGRGALGLPGDLSSSSRFARVAFTKQHAIVDDDAVSQMFHILGTVEQVRGCCEVEDGRYEFTRYTSCCDAAHGVYYYTTYENRRITAVNMGREPLDGKRLIVYPLVASEQIQFQNAFPVLD